MVVEVEPEDVVASVVVVWYEASPPISPTKGIFGSFHVSFTPFWTAVEREYDQDDCIM